MIYHEYSKNISGKLTGNWQGLIFEKMFVFHSIEFV